jgi:hypothetical protein
VTTAPGVGAQSWIVPSATMQPTPFISAVQGLGDEVEATS